MTTWESGKPKESLILVKGKGKTKGEPIESVRWDNDDVTCF